MRLNNVEDVRNFLVEDVTRDWVTCKADREEYDELIDRYIEARRNAFEFPMTLQSCYNDFEEWAGPI